MAKKAKAAYGPRAVTNEKGIVFDPDGGFAASVTQKARRKGFADMVCFMATFPNGDREYVLFDGQDPVRSNTSFEDMCCWIDIMAFNRDAPPDL